MTIKDVRKRVSSIEAKSDFSEEAHVDEDNLYIDVLEEIASGTNIARELAIEALKANKIVFDRWYA